MPLPISRPSMNPADEIAEVAPNGYLWHNYDATVKADLFSSALKTEDGLCLVDPIPLRADALAQLIGNGKVAAIIVTNENHRRAADQFAARWDLPIAAQPATYGASPPAKFHALTDGESIATNIKVISIDGAPPGEIALHHSAGEGAMVIGDGLINFAPHGFSLLPAKYCSNAKQMRRSLDKLLEYKFEMMLFAHGDPILSGARARLEILLAAR